MTRLCAVAAPSLLLVSGVLRWVGTQAGRTPLLLALMLFALLATLIRPARDPFAAVATAATVVGAAGFAWTVAGAPAGPVRLLGPLMFQFGLVALLALLAYDSPPRLPVWSPLVVLAGLALLAGDLALLPLAALAVGAGLAPLAYSRPLATTTS